MTYYKIGKEVDGDDALGCQHMRDWYPAFAREVKNRYNVALEIIQAKGRGSKSGGTHADGTALDLRTWRFSNAVTLGIVQLAREMGARATWYRTKAQGFDPHIHLVIDCPCSSAADYQTAAVDAGYNGLGSGGRKGKDTHPKPSTKRNYKQGIAWAGGTTPTPAPDATNKKEAQDMTPEQDALLRQINLAICGREGIENTGATAARHVWTGTKVNRSGKQISAIQELADAKTGVLQLQGQVAGLTAAVTALAKGNGVDPAAIEKAVADAVAKALSGASVTVELGK